MMRPHNTTETNSIISTLMSKYDKKLIHDAMRTPIIKDDTIQLIRMFASHPAEVNRFIDIQQFIAITPGYSLHFKDTKSNTLAKGLHIDPAKIAKWLSDNKPADVFLEISPYRDASQRDGEVVLYFESENPTESQSYLSLLAYLQDHLWQEDTYLKERHLSTYQFSHPDREVVESWLTRLGVSAIRQQPYVLSQTWEKGSRVYTNIVGYLTEEEQKTLQASTVGYDGYGILIS